jgi:ribose transport system substrate-binding protein
MSIKERYFYILASVLVIIGLVATACQPAATPPPTEAPAAPQATEAPAAGGEERWQQPIVIGWTPPDITGVFKTATDFFEKSAADGNSHGFDIQIISQSPATHVAFADQVAIIEDYIQREVDVIAISPIEVEVIKPAVQKANEMGIPVIIVNLLEPIEGLQIDSYIGFDNTIGAEVTAYALLDYFGGPGVLGSGEKVDVADDQYLDIEFWRNLYGNLSDDVKSQIVARGAIIEGVAGGFFSQARLNGFHNVVDQFPGIEVVGAPCAADWNREKGVKCAEDFLQANPDNLDFIWAASNEMGLGAMLASEGVNRLELASESPTVGDETVAIFTNDVTPESVDRISEGKIVAETTHGFADWGWFGTEFAVRRACGLEVQQTFDIRPRIAYQVNARQFYPDPVLPPIDWEAIKAECK